MERAAIIRNLINANGYKVSDVSRISGLPYSTVKYILENGINKAAYGNVCRICSAVGITTDDLENMVNGEHSEYALTRREIDLLDKYRGMDDRGRRNVDSVVMQNYKESVSENIKEKDGASAS